MQSPFSVVHCGLTVYILRSLVRRAGRSSVHTTVPGRLLYVAASCLPYHVSGYTSRTQALLCALRDAGGDVQAVTRTGYPWDRRDSLARPDDTITLVGEMNYEHFRKPRNNRFTAVYAAQAASVLERYAKEQQIAVMHAASNHVNALPALIAARRLGIPFQYEMRGLWEITRIARQPEFQKSHNFRLGLMLEGFVAAHADRVFVISNQLGRYAAEHWGIPAERLHLLPNCVDTEHVQPVQAAVQPFTIGYAGSLINYEGLDTLLHAVRLLRQSTMSVRLEIAGHGEAREGLERLTTELGLQDVVHFCGRLSPEEARAHVARCALVCIPRKPFTVCEMITPIKLVEALAMEKPVIVPDLPVFRDEAGDTAWFFRSGDAEDLARVLSTAFADPERCAAMAREGRQRVLSSRQWRLFAPDVLSGGKTCLAQ